MNSEHNEKEHDWRLKLYGEARADLLKRQLSNTENSDRAILSVSTAALGFSLAFLKDIVKIDHTEYGFLLYLSWGLFVLSVLATLISFFTSQIAISDQLVKANQYYIENNFEAADSPSKFARLTEYLNVSGATSLAAGLICTCFFVGINLSKGNDMSKKTPQRDQVEIRGATIPKLQNVPSNPHGGATIPSLQKLPTPPNTNPKNG